MPYKPAHPCNAPGCPRLTTRRYCPEHQRAYDARRDAERGTAAERGYDQQWRNVRQRALARDGFRCRACGSGEGLEVHHVVPMSKGGSRFALSNLMTLCGTCHRRVTAALRG